MSCLYRGRCFSVPQKGVGKRGRQKGNQRRKKLPKTLSAFRNLKGYLHKIIRNLFSNLRHIVTILRTLPLMHETKCRQFCANLARNLRPNLRNAPFANAPFSGCLSSYVSHMRPARSDAHCGAIFSNYIAHPDVCASTRLQRLHTRTPLTLESEKLTSHLFALH